MSAAESMAIRHFAHLSMFGNWKFLSHKVRKYCASFTFRSAAYIIKANTVSGGYR